jgi:hypothetical protein
LIAVLTKHLDSNGLVGMWINVSGFFVVLSLNGDDGINFSHFATLNGNEVNTFF